jgi:predicted aconitase
MATLGSVGADFIVVGAFGDLERVEDQWLAEKCAAGNIDSCWITFSEMVEWSAEHYVTAAELADSAGEQLPHCCSVSAPILGCRRSDMMSDGIYIHNIYTRMCQMLFPPPPPPTLF